MLNSRAISYLMCSFLYGRNSEGLHFMRSSAADYLTISLDKNLLLPAPIKIVATEYILLC